jgi:hypothetical protein
MMKNDISGEKRFAQLLSHDGKQPGVEGKAFNIGLTLIPEHSLKVEPRHGSQVLLVDIADRSRSLGIDVFLRNLRRWNPTLDVSTTNSALHNAYRNIIAHELPQPISKSHSHGRAVLNFWIVGIDPFKTFAIKIIVFLGAALKVSLFGSIEK